MLEHNAMNNKNTRRAHGRAQHAVLSTLRRRPLMHNGVTSHLWLKSALHASSHPCMCTCVLRLSCFLLALSCPLLRPTVLLPALPDVYLTVQREVQVQPPVRLPLGDRGHFRPWDTPHTWHGVPVRLVYLSQTQVRQVPLPAFLHLAVLEKQDRKFHVSSSFVSELANVRDLQDRALFVRQSYFDTPPCEGLMSSREQLCQNPQSNRSSQYSPQVCPVS